MTKFINPILILAALSMGLIPVLHAQKPTGAFAFPKPLKDQLQVLPFVGEVGSLRIKPNDREAPDELRMTVTGQQIVIAGTKKSDIRRVMGRITGHHGKLVLMPSTLPGSGTLSAKVQSITDATAYGLSLELANGTLNSRPVRLDPNTSYDWSAKPIGADFVVEVNLRGQLIKSVKAPAADVKAFGFYATVRYPGSKANLLVDVAPPPKQP